MLDQPAISVNENPTIGWNYLSVTSPVVEDPQPLQIVEVRTEWQLFLHHGRLALAYLWQFFKRSF